MPTESLNLLIPSLKQIDEVSKLSKNREIKHIDDLNEEKKNLKLQVKVICLTI